MAKRQKKTQLASGLIPAVAYYRMSSKKQDKSIPAQRAEVEKYAIERGFEVVRWEPYVDEGISGSESDRREGFKRLMRDAVEQNDFEVILCWDQDRFSRFDPLEANHYWYLLRKAGVRIVTVRQGELDLNELGGWLMASINQHGKAQYLKDISANVLRGRLRKAGLGFWVGSRAPYGYAMDQEGRLVLGPDEHVQAVHFIFRSYLDRDTSLREIASLLNAQGVPSPSGRKWAGGKVQCILRRETYTGRAAQLRESKGKFHTVREGNVVATGEDFEPTVKPADEWFYVDCPPLVSADDWKLAAAKLKRRRGRTTPIQGGGKGLLNGLLYCGHCGKRMTANNKALDSSGDMVYCCRTYNLHGVAGCHRNLIHQAALLPFLVQQIQQLVLAPENFSRLDREIRRQLGSKNDTRPGEAKRLKASIARLEGELKAAVAELRRSPDDLYEMAVEAVRELRDQRDGLAASLEALGAAEDDSAADLDAKAAAALERIQELSQMLQSTEPAVVREALGRICERVDLWFEHKKGPKSTRSFFRRGIITFRQPTGLFVPANRPD